MISYFYIHTESDDAVQRYTIKTYFKFYIQLCGTGFWTNEISPWVELANLTVMETKQHFVSHLITSHLIRTLSQG